MSRRLVLGIAAIALGLSAWTACTGDDPISAQTGAVGQPCNSGGTCNAPELSCVKNVCQTASSSGSGTSGSATSGGTSGPGSSSGSASSSGSTSGAMSSSSSSGGGDPKIRLDITPQACEPIPFAEGPHCPGAPGNQCEKGKACCPDGAALTCGVTSCDRTMVWTCETQAHCSGSQVCCIRAEKRTSQLCSEEDLLMKATSFCVPTREDCKAADLWNTCEGASECQSNDCQRHEIVTNEGLRLVLKMCAQQNF